jgi:uncharacterized protein (TIGR00725 family)
MIGVMGSSREEHAESAVPLGRWIAEQGFDLLTGGGGGVMTAVCRGFRQVPNRAGVAVGILPAGPPAGYPNPYVDIVIQTHLPKRGEEGADERSRNHINVLSADVLIALPGGPGTRSEVELAARYRRPLIAYLGPKGAITGLLRERLPADALTQTEVETFVLQQTDEDR